MACCCCVSLRVFGVFQVEGMTVNSGGTGVVVLVCGSGSL